MGQRVEGVEPDGAAIDELQPILISGVDHSSIHRTFRVSETGRLITLLNVRPEVTSSIRGPASFEVSSSSNQTLVPAPGAGLHIFLTHISGSANDTGIGSVNFKQGSTDIRWGTLLEFKGDRFIVDFSPAWKLPENTSLIVQVDTAKTVRININFYVES